MIKKILFAFVVVLSIFSQLSAPIAFAGTLEEELGKSIDDVIIIDSDTTIDENPYTEYHVASIDSPIELLKYAIFVLLSIVAVIAILFIIIGGYYYITAHGEEGQTEKGKKIIVGAVTGLLVVIASYTIVATILNFGALNSSSSKSTEEPPTNPPPTQP